MNKLILIGFLLLSIIFTFSIEASAAAISRIDVDGLESITQEELLEILDLKINSVLDDAKVRNGIKLAFRKGIFEDIAVETDDNDKSHIIIKVRERDTIKNIYIEGNKTFTKRAIEKLFLVKENAILRYDLKDYYAAEMKSALADRGFSKASVEIKTEQTQQDYKVNLFLIITEGEPDVIKSISINGPSDKIKTLLKIAEGDIYDQSKVRKSIEKIKTYYKENNYLAAVVGPYSFDEGELIIDVDPGKKLNIIFEGNRSINSNDLLKETSIFEAGEFSEDIVDEAASRISALYHANGFPFVQIAPVITTSSDDINISFFIFEGEEISVNSIKFTGITIEEEKLSEIISLKKGSEYNPDSVDTDVKTIIELYNSLGYLNAKIEDVKIEIKQSAADISFLINEGSRTLIDEIEIKGARIIQPEEIRKSIELKVGDPYNEMDISNARFKIIDLYNSLGFSDTAVNVNQELTEKGMLLTFNINEMPLTFFGSTVITGNKATNYKVIKRELLYKEGSPFSRALVNKSRQKLYKLGLFTDVALEQIEKTDITKDIQVKVKEGNAGAVEFGVGYGDYERYRGSLGLSYRNLFGMNRQASFRTELSTLESRYVANYTEPWFLGYKIPFKVTFLHENRTEIVMETRETRYKLKKYSANMGVEKELNDYFKGELYYEYALVNTYDVKPGIILTKEDTGTLTISSIRPALVYDTRDNPFDPKKGILAGITLKTASGFLLSETDFVKTILSLSGYQQIFKNFVVAASFRSGFAEGFRDTEELPLVERFFLGGRTTVRGYEQDTLGPKGFDGSPTGGNAFVLTNIEFRIGLSKSFGLVAFLDGGNVWRKTSDIKLADMKYTSGLGLRYNTPVGPIRIDYGYKLQRDKGESSGELHFTIGHAF
jgi:outer membrane protein insertion porin family